MQNRIIKTIRRNNKLITITPKEDKRVILKYKPNVKIISYSKKSKYS